MTRISFTIITLREYLPDNGDDTITIDTPEHVHHDMFTDTYSIQMKAANMNVAKPQRMVPAAMICRNDFHSSGNSIYYKRQR